MADYPSVPSLTSLMQESRGVPPLSRGAFEQPYLGRRVCWQLVFATATRIGDGTIFQVLATQRPFWQRFGSWTFFQVAPALSPALLTVVPGRRLRVCGAIIRIQTDAVVLDVESLEVLPKSVFDRFRY